MTKKKIILHGYLKDLYAAPIEVEAATVAEAMRSLEQIPELQPEDGQPHPVVILGVESEMALYANTTMEEIHVHPRTGGGGGRNGIMQVLIGVALIAIGIWNPAFLASVGISSTQLFLAGGLMALGGILQMLAPKPDEDDERTSNYLGATQNTVKIGTPIPLGYGTRKIGGHYLSFDVDAVNVSSGPSGQADVSQVVLRDGTDQDYVTAISTNAQNFYAHTFSPLSGVTDGEVIELTPPGTPLVRYVYIQGAEGVNLQLSELQVFGFDPGSKTEGADLTVIYGAGMSVTMSSEPNPSNGGENILDQDPTTYAQTGDGAMEWIKVDLGRNLELSSIRLKATNSLGSRLNGSVVALWHELGVGEVTTGSPNESFFTEVDKTTVPLAVVNPVYASNVASPLNVPTSAWID